MNTRIITKRYTGTDNCVETGRKAYNEEICSNNSIIAMSQYSRWSLCCPEGSFTFKWHIKRRNYKYDAKSSTFKLSTLEADVVFLGDSITAYID